MSAVSWASLHRPIVDDGVISDEGDDSHLALALGTNQGIDLIDLAGHLGPAPPWDLPSLLLDDQELSLLCLVHLSSVCIGVMRAHSGDKLDIIHPLKL